MQINELKVTVGEVCEGYFNDAEEGVVGYDERLDIRPKYQREFVYKDAQRDEVIRTVMKGLPLNVMYWCRLRKQAAKVRSPKSARRPVRPHGYFRFPVHSPCTVLASAAGHAFLPLFQYTGYFGRHIPHISPEAFSQDRF